VGVFNTHRGFKRAVHLKELLHGSRVVGQAELLKQGGGRNLQRHHGRNLWLSFLKQAASPVRKGSAARKRAIADTLLEQFAHQLSA
jgi:hypothetical protein